MVKKQIYSIGLFIASVLLAVSSLFLPVFIMSFSLMASIIYFFVSMILSCVLFAFSITNTQSLWVIGAGVVLTFLGSWIFSGSASVAILFLIIFIPVGAALGLGYRNKKAFNETVMKASVNSVILALIAFIVLIGELSGGSFDVKDALGPVSENLKQYLIELFSVEDPSLELISQYVGDSVKALALYFYNYIITNIPTFYMSFILLEAVIGFWIIKTIMKRTSEQVSFMGRFSDCKISFAGAAVYVICNLCYLLLSEYDFAFAFYNFSNIMNYVFIYAGVSLIAYFMEFKKLGTVARTLILGAVIVISFTSALFSGLVSLLGLFDSGFNFRNHIENSGY